MVTLWPMTSCRCIPALMAATQHCLGGSGCGKHRSGSPWPASWRFYHWHTGTPPGRSWFCGGYSSVRLCRSHSSEVCRPGRWCSSYRRGGRLCRSSPSSGTCCLSAGRERAVHWLGAYHISQEKQDIKCATGTPCCSKELPQKYLWCELLQLCLVLYVVAGSDHTQPALLHHLTPTVLIGHSGGHPHATGSRAGAPLCGLLNAVEARVPIVKTHCLFLTIGWRNKQKDRGPWLREDKGINTLSDENYT